MTENIYAKRDHEAQGAHYLRHIDRMTIEELHSKSAIAGELAHRDAEIAAIKKDSGEMRQKMVATAEEIHGHWTAHCDADGYGPINLQHRLESQFGVSYPGYTIGTFKRMHAEIAALTEALQRLADLYDTDEGCRTLPEYIAARAVLTLGITAFERAT